ncbi:MAG: ABC transporter permease, partial [Ruminococcus sp.]|nr:ABC transporter permease [Ruminococcus sp.]
VSFALVTASPADPVGQYILGLGTAVSPEQRARIEDYWGVNKPPVQRYLDWLGSIIRGDMGESALYRRPVADIIGERFKSSFALMLFAWILSSVIGVGLGCVMGMNRGRAADRIIKKICYLMNCAPSFWIGLILLYVFSVRLGVFPIGFSSPIGVTEENVTLMQKIRHIILPGVTLSLSSFSDAALHTRQKLIDVLNSDYVLFARARGESERTVFWRHGLRNILLPALTLRFVSFSELFGGSVLAENVFSYPGLGSAAAAAGLNSDVPLLLGITLFSALFVCIGNMTADLLYGIIDPRTNTMRATGEGTE